jgi:adenine-specific DNA-methyltransferase
MKNRLEVAKQLLRDDGFFCCHIDDHEGQYLKVLLDEIFGRDNFLTIFNIRVRYPDKTLKQDMDFHKEIEHIHIYRKSPRARPNLNEKDTTVDKYVYYFKELKPGKEIMLGGKKVVVFQPDEYKLEKGEPSFDGRKEIWASGSILDGNSSGRFFRDFLTGRYEIDGYGVAYKVYGVGDESGGYRYFTGPNKKGATKGKYYQGVPSKQEEGDKSTTPINNYYDLAGSFGNCRSEGGVELRSGKKPELLLQLLVHHFSYEGDIVMDYHLGSGTTVAVAHKMSRQFIGIEQLDYGSNDSVARLSNVMKGEQTGISKDVGWEGGGSFVYAELKKANQAWIDEVMAAEGDEALNDLWEKMQKHAFISYKVEPKAISETAKDFESLDIEDKKRFLVEVLDKNALYVNLSDIENQDFQVSEKDKALTKLFYSLK